jgi:hypothetical protein
MTNTPSTTTKRLGKHALTLWTQKNAEQILQALAELYREQLDIENAKTHAVARARTLGIPWQTIAAELNITEQAAWTHWRWVEPPTE